MGYVLGFEQVISLGTYLFPFSSHFLLKIHIFFFQVASVSCDSGTFMGGPSLHSTCLCLPVLWVSA